MEVSPLDPTRPDEPELDLYTIPSRSSWFVWDEIHETESVLLREFFDGTSITRTPKIYREYRDFIINKYREEPSRRLSFTEVRKSLVGDVNLLRKVFEFLQNWGLINFSASPVAGKCGEEGETSVARVSSATVKVEEGVPSGIRVAAVPNSIKPIAAPESQSDDPITAGGGAVSKFPPLASYTDVFADSIRKIIDFVACGNCGDHCDSGHYKDTQDDFLICMKCFERGNYGENKTIDNYKLVEVVQGNPNWSEAETLTLLESVLKFGDDWDLIAQNLPMKNKLECISKLIELPLGDVFGSPPVVGTSNNSSDDLLGNSNSLIPDIPSLPIAENQETPENGEQNDEKIDEAEQNGDSVEQIRPSKRQRIDSFSSPGSSLMEQVALISAMVDPHIAAAAADAAIALLCEENSWPRDIFEAADSGDSDLVKDELQNPATDVEKKRIVDVGEPEMEVGPAQSENQERASKKEDSDLPPTLRIRTAVATALGAAAARAKLLADQEEREIEHLVATVIGTEVKKLHCKMKHFEDLEVMMKKKRSEMDEIEEALLTEQINVLQAGFKAGVPRWKNHPSVKS